MSDIYAALDLDELVTGEAVTLDLPPASIGLRVASGLIDIVAEVALLVGAIFAATALASDEALLAVGSIVAVVGCLVVLPTVVETLTRGRSLGKLCLGLRTVRSDAGPISFRHALIRALVGFVEVFVLSGVPALISGLVSGKGQRVGDHVAGTYVVRTRVRLVLPPPVAMPPELAGWAAAADVAPLPDHLALAVRQLVARRDSLSPQSRTRLVAELAGQVAAYVAPPPPRGTAPEAFLAAVQAERRERDARRLAREAQLRERLKDRWRDPARQA
ncbi:RDD family protein [Nocardioides mangrovicus]|uniref:RDD family protein n=1 Tax=Nocardioides mangrovicus TaxID=2478913 RepID=A0A3L8P5G9_9ACTN|nr:RDD family protein [Nocardioides mangrovicus]RLV50620.1 RDD family protein [Nocardioides mangrovicus]